jgi:hypothetical protein
MAPGKLIAVVTAKASELQGGGPSFRWECSTSFHMAGIRNAGMQSSGTLLAISPEVKTRTGINGFTNADDDEVGIAMYLSPVKDRFNRYDGCPMKVDIFLSAIPVE